MPDKRSIPSTSIVGFSDIRREPVQGWEGFLKEGGQFLDTAANAYAGRRKVFTTVILYNLVAMAIEKLFMALLMKSGNLPYNHTMVDLVAAVEEYRPGFLTPILADRLKAMDRYQEICDLDKFRMASPTMAETGAMLDLAAEVRTLTMAHIVAS